MMGALLARANRIARAAQSVRLQQIATTMRGQGLAAAVDGESVVVRGSKLANRWIADPLLRFAGRSSR
jgi:hypothetical protein